MARSQMASGQMASGLGALPPEIFRVITPFLAHAASLRAASRQYHTLIMSIHCDKIGKLPPNVEVLIADEALPDFKFPDDMQHMKVLKLLGGANLPGSELAKAIGAPQLVELVWCVRLESPDDSAFKPLLTAENLRVLHLYEFVPDYVLECVGKSRLEFFCAWLDGQPTNVKKIAKCKTLRKVGLYAYKYPSDAFNEIAKLSLVDFDLNGAMLEQCPTTLNHCSIECTSATFDYGILKTPNLTSLALTCDSVVGELPHYHFKFLLITVRARYTLMRLPVLPYILMLSVGGLSIQMVKELVETSPDLSVLHFFLLNCGTPEDRDALLAVLSTSKLEYLGICCDSQLQLIPIKDVCPKLKVLVLEGTEQVTEELRLDATPKNIFFEESITILSKAAEEYPCISRYC